MTLLYLIITQYKIIYPGHTRFLKSKNKRSLQHISMIPLSQVDVKDRTKCYWEWYSLSLKRCGTIRSEMSPNPWGANRRKRRETSSQASELSCLRQWAALMPTLSKTPDQLQLGRKKKWEEEEIEEKIPQEKFRNGESTEKKEHEENCVRQPGRSHNDCCYLTLCNIFPAVKDRNKHKLLWKPGLYYHLIVCTELNGLGS